MDDIEETDEGRDEVEEDEDTQGDAGDMVRHDLQAFSTEIEEPGVDFSAFDNDDAAKVEAAAAELAEIPEAMAAIWATRDAIK